jgi:outer membrane protein
MKKWMLTLMVLFSLGMASAQSKVAHVNSQKLLDTLQSRKDAVKKLETKESELILDLQEQEAEFNKALAEYEKKRPDMTPTLIKFEEEKLMKKQQMLQETQASHSEELQLYSQELNQPILQMVQDAIKEVAAVKKLDYVIDETVTLYFRGELDITNEVMPVLLKMDAQYVKTHPSN